MPNFAALCPIILYLPAMIIALVAVIVCVTHCIVMRVGRRPATPGLAKGPARVRNGIRSGGLPYTYRGLGIAGAIYANNFTDPKRG
jgi:hypothetical protein